MDIQAAAPYELTNTRHGLMLANRNDVYMGQALMLYGECCAARTVVPTAWSSCALPSPYADHITCPWAGTAISHAHTGVDGSECQSSRFLASWVRPAAW